MLCLCRCCRHAVSVGVAAMLCLCEFAAKLCLCRCCRHAVSVGVAAMLCLCEFAAMLCLCRYCRHAVSVGVAAMLCLCEFAAMLCQDGKVVSYARQALSSVEQRYSQTEREMLAVVLGAEHFHLHLYGAQFDIITDHKTLLGILASPKQASVRIERWRLRLLTYRYNLRYRPGRYEESPADYLSRPSNELRLIVLNNL